MPNLFTPTHLRTPQKAASPLAGALRQPDEIRGFFRRIASRYDLANTVLSAGLDQSWRRHVARAVAAVEPALILDLAAGSGVLTRELARASPNAQVVAVDFCAPILSGAISKGCAHVAAGDGLRLPFAPEAFDVATVAFGLRNMQDYRVALQEVRRVLREGGRMLVLDFSIPGSPWTPVYLWYLRRILPILAALLTGERRAYEYLGESIESFPTGDRFLELLRESGFTDVSQRRLTGGIVSVYTGRKAPA